MADNQNLQLGNYTLATEVYQKTDVNQISNIIVDDYTTQIENVSEDLTEYTDTKATELSTSVTTAYIAADTSTLDSAKSYADGKADAAKTAAEQTAHNELTAAVQIAHNELTAETDALCAEIDIVKRMIPEPVAFDNKTIVDGADGKEVAIDNDTIVYDSEISAIKTVVDDRITYISENPVQNNVITEKILQLETAIQLLMDNKPTTRIYNRAGLENISANLTADYLIMNDIDMGDEYWVGPQNFAGTINGNGHTIRNMKLASIKYNALIGTTAANSNVMIRDLNVENVTMDLQDNYADVSYSIVSQLSTIDGAQKAILHDGSIADLMNNTVYICKRDSGADNYYVDNDGNVNGYEPGGAALIGKSGKGSNITISNCKTSGTLGTIQFAIDGTGPGSLQSYYPLGHQTAGFIARFEGNTDVGNTSDCTLNITNCENNIDIFTEFNKAGGFNAMIYGNGQRKSSTIQDCINNGRIIAGKASALDINNKVWGGVAGFIGHNDGNKPENVQPRSMISYCKNNGDIYTFSELSIAYPYNYYGCARFGTFSNCDPESNNITKEMPGYFEPWKNEYQWYLSSWTNHIM